MDRQFAENFFESGVGAAILVFSLLAVTSIIQSRIHGTGMKILWSLFALIVPVAGASLWFFAGRETPNERHAREASTN